MVPMIVSVPSLPSSAANTIINPANLAMYLPYSDISANGEMGVGTKVRVRLKKGSYIGGESPFITSEMADTWEHFFDAPGTGWTVGADWKCYLYDEEDNRLDDTSYAVGTGEA